MKILLTGRAGQVGSELAKMLPALGEVVATGHDTLDLTAPDAVRAFVRDVRPDLIVNAAAYNAVDRAESDAAQAHAVNATAPAVMAEEAKRLGALIVHYSTDYVFDGTKTSAYVETDATNPLGEYARSKLAGEQAVLASGADALVLRVCWVYDGSRANFVTTMLRLARERDELRVVGDQVGAPTWARGIAEATVAAIRDLERARAASGLYHLAAAGQVDRFELVRRLFELTAGERPKTPRLVRIATSDYPLPAPRPLNSVFDTSKLRSAFGIELDHWDRQLQDCLAARSS